VLFFSTISPLLVALPFLKEKRNRSKIIALSSGVAAGVLGLFTFEIWGDSQWYIFYTIIPVVALLYALLARIAFENKEIYTPFFYLS
jgi:TctA family transporter